MTRPMLRLAVGPSQLGVTHLDWHDAMRLARFLAAVTGRRMEVRPHPLPVLGWIVQPVDPEQATPAGERGRLARHLRSVR